MPSNKAATVLSYLLLATTGYAVDEATPIDVCKDISIIAREVMTARQTGKPLSETLPNAIKQFREMHDRFKVETDEEGDEAIADLVIAAYDIPAYSSERLQQNAISEFENMFFAMCYKGMTSDSEE